MDNVSKLTTVIDDLHMKQSANPSNTRNWHHCWNHGYSSGHSSQDCNKPKPRHEKGATKDDTKGGSTRHKPS